MKYADFAGDLGRRIGSYLAAEDARRERLADAIDNPTTAQLPAGWGTSPRRAPTAATYKPAHGGYPGEVKA